MNMINSGQKTRMSTRNQVRKSGQQAPRTHLAYQNRYMVIGTILVIALIAFEIFNFDTTKFALTDLLGDVKFAGLSWSAILAVAFCGIDLAGLIRVFTPDGEEGKDQYYLMAAWLLGATMNAVMTWYAISITLLSNDIGNEVVSREALLFYVPIFVAVLVWLTRVLFIGAFSIAGEQLFHIDQSGDLNTKVKKSSKKRPVNRSGRQPVPSQHVQLGHAPVAMRSVPHTQSHQIDADPTEDQRGNVYVDRERPLQMEMRTGQMNGGEMGDGSNHYKSRDQHLVQHRSRIRAQQ